MGRRGNSEELGREMVTKASKNSREVAGNKMLDKWAGSKEFLKNLVKEAVEKTVGKICE